MTASLNTLRFQIPHKEAETPKIGKLHPCRTPAPQPCLKSFLKTLIPMIFDDTLFYIAGVTNLGLLSMTARTPLGLNKRFASITSARIAL